MHRKGVLPCLACQSFIKGRYACTQLFGEPEYQGVWHFQAGLSSGIRDPWHVCGVDRGDFHAQVPPQVNPPAAWEGMHHHLRTGQGGDRETIWRGHDSYGIEVEEVRFVGKGDKNAGVEYDQSGHSSFRA